MPWSAMVVSSRVYFLSKLKYHFSVPGQWQWWQATSLRSEPLQREPPAASQGRTPTWSGATQAGVPSSHQIDRACRTNNARAYHLTCRACHPGTRARGEGMCRRGKMPIGPPRLMPYVHRNLKNVKVGRKLLQFNPKDDDLYLDRMDQGQGPGSKVRVRVIHGLGGGQNGAFRGMGGGQQQPPPNQVFPPYGMGGGGPPPTAQLRAYP